jgi:putative Ca2+/H+ antiporter (TMEM165/GDT1 family)
MKVFWISFVTLFPAELGDKTQLAIITLTSKTQAPWLVLAGSVLALAMVSLLGVLVGEALLRVVPEPVIKKGAAVLFVVIGVLMFFDKV